MKDLTHLVVLGVVLLGLIIAAKIWLSMDPVYILNPVEIEVDKLNMKRRTQKEDEDELRKHLARLELEIKFNSNLFNELSQNNKPR